MIVKEMNEGAKIPYTVRGNKITFDDEVMFNLEKYQRDDPNHLDLCRDAYGNLVTGVIPGLAEAYVAQVDIPAREYIDTPPTAPEPLAEGEQEENGAGGEMEMQGGTREAVPFSMDKCTLTLWAVE